MLCKKAALKSFIIFTGKQLCWNLFREKETPTQVTSCEYCEIYKDTYFEEHLPRAASVYGTKILISIENCFFFENI